LNPATKRVLRFVVVVGVVNLFADLTYEGGRGIVGAYLGHLGASGALIGAAAGAGELIGYAVRSVSGAFADRTGRYWVTVWVGYAINMLCVPALALAGNWPLAAGLMIGERLGRGIRKPVMSAMLAEAGRELGGGGRVFGFNQMLDQFGATIGPLVVAYAVLHGGYRSGFGVLIVPAILTLATLSIAAVAGRNVVPPLEDESAPPVRDWAAFRRYAIGGALLAAGFVDFALIAFRFQRDNIAGVAAISVLFAVAMGVSAVASPILGWLFDRAGKPVIVAAVAIASLAAPLAFLGSGAWATAGAALWGVGIAVEDALLLALVATIIVKRRKAAIFGLYDLIFGVAWFAGSTVAGVLLDRSTVALAIFSTLLQLAAIPFFI